MDLLFVFNRVELTRVQNGLIVVEYVEVQVAVSLVFGIESLVGVPRLLLVQYLDKVLSVFHPNLEFRGQSFERVVGRLGSRHNSHHLLLSVDLQSLLMLRKLDNN